MAAITARVTLLASTPLEAWHGHCAGKHYQARAVRAWLGKRFVQQELSCRKSGWAGPKELSNGCNKRSIFFPIFGVSSYKPPYIWYWFDSILLWFQMSSSWTGLLKNYQKSKSNLLSRHTNPLQTKFCSWKDLQICMIDNFSMSDVQLPGILRHCAGHSSSLWSCQRPPLRVTTVVLCSWWEIVLAAEIGEWVARC